MDYWCIIDELWLVFTLTVSGCMFTTVSHFTVFVCKSPFFLKYLGLCAWPGKGHSKLRTRLIRSGTVTMLEWEMESIVNRDEK